MVQDTQNKQAQEQSRKAGTAHRVFKKASPSGPIIDAAREVVRMELALSNKLHVAKHDLEHIRKLPAGAGVVLISNHADEMDPRICLELSRRSGRRFISMCNREAFDELSGFAGWALQHLGHFSVERGAHDSHARDFAIDIVKEGKNVLLIFPEGEIFYLNEEVQPFHSGAVEICMQAILQMREKNPDWTAFIVPMAIKYHHRGRIEKVLEMRITRMERRLELLPMEDATFAERLKRIQRELLLREDMQHEVRISLEEDLFEQIITTEKTILARVEERHREVSVTQHEVIDESWQLSAEIRADLEGTSDDSVREELAHELSDLEEVAQLTSWRPYYYEGDVSADRLAEAVMKLERELYKIKRPRQLSRRDVHIKVAEPIDLGKLADDYRRDPRAFRHSFTTELHDNVQALVDALVYQCARRQ
ncbi:MAG: 1-acyl-sn-glycerol-3-phosphate acyltransferase [Candidatus Melainabacteria bacterium]|nr:1-acyl-sn-glycerol-3-phosphate acyltransferase [Candidatus Melainabacteria bacterium]